MHHPPTTTNRNIYPPEPPKPSRKEPLRRLLRRLGPQLHQQKHHQITAQRENHHHPRIPPPLIVAPQVQTRQVVATTAILAHATALCSLWIDQVRAGAHALEIWGEILGTGCIVGGIEEGEFVGGTLHRGVVVCEDEKGAHEVVEGVEVVEPIAPKGGDGLVGHEDAAEEDEDGDDHGIDEGGEDGVGGVGGDELADARVDELVDEHDEEGGASFIGVGGEADGVVPADVVKDGADAEVGDFGDDEAGDKGFPGIHFAFAFTDFVNVSALDEEGLKLGNDAWSDEDEIKHGEEAELEVRNTISNHPERKTVEEGGTDMEGEFVVDVVNVFL